MTSNHHDVMVKSGHRYLLGILLASAAPPPEWLTENELSDLSRLWHDGCVKATIETQDVDRNHSSEV
jgi:hypothetical protein